MISAAIQRLYTDALKYRLPANSFRQGNTVVITNKYITALLRPQHGLIYSNEETRHINMRGIE